MNRIAAILTDLFEDIEYTEPVRAFKKEGHNVVNIGLEAGKTVLGKKRGTQVKIDVPVAKAEPGSFDALLIPGGYSPDRLRIDDNAVSFTKEFMNSNRWVFTICHGPQLLITADALRGRKCTGWKSIARDIKNAGAEYVDAAVVIDGNLVSSRHPGDIDAFIKTSISMLNGFY